MALSKRDLVFIAMAILLLALLLVNSARSRAKPLPADETHRHVAESLARGGGRENVEKGCLACHGVSGRPFPPNHPPKEQCLICHAAGP